MKVWCFWMVLTICCMTLMPLFVARSFLGGTRFAQLPPRRQRASQAVR